MAEIKTTKVFRTISEAIDKSYTTISAQGSSRSGKTYNIIIWLVVYALTHKNTRVSVVRGTRPALKGSVWLDFKEIIFSLDLWDSKAENKTDLTYHLSNGSWFEFFSGSDEQKIRGWKRDVLFVNEANELTELQYQQLAMRTTRFTILDYNPSFTEDHWISSNVNKDERTFHFITTYKDNPFLEQVIIDEIESLREKNKSLWRVYGLGLQAVIEGLIFTNVEVVDAFPDYCKREWIGIDYGFTHDPTAVVRVGVYEDRLYIEELLYQTQMTNSDLIKFLKGLGIGRTKIIAENAEPQRAEEIRRAGFNVHKVKKYPDSVTSGVNKMLEYKICPTARSYNAQKELKNYTYAQDREGRWLNEPVDAYNHIIDAVRYCVMSEIMGGERNKANMERLSRLVY